MPQLTLTDSDYEYHRAYRPAGKRMIGGVAEGLAVHLGVNVFWVRLAFVVASWFNGVGVLAYALLWRMLPLGEPDDDAGEPAGIAAATRRGLRTPAGRGPQMLSDPLQTIALLAVGVGVLLLVQAAGWGLGPQTLIPVLIGVAGLAVVWRQADDASWNRWVASGGWPMVARLGLGTALLVLAVGYVIAQRSGFNALVDVFAALAIAVIGIGLLVGPWIYRLTRELTDERRERVRTQERADVAAHLHDSVLQTLAILQKNSDDPRMVATLARRQERELREWLYGDRLPSETTLRGALDAAAAQVEDDHGIPVDVVGVGDIEAMNAHAEALARAAGEAIVNAAKHSGAASIDVYAEVGGDEVAVFVRDRGAGFDPDEIPESEQGTKMGIRQSIVARMERHGGVAEIRSAPGDGTEVRLTMPRHRLDEGENV